jgi:hypothetical protein
LVKGFACWLLASASKLMRAMDGARADADILCGGLKSLGLDPKFVQGQGSTMENNSVGSC